MKRVLLLASVATTLGLAGIVGSAAALAHSSSAAGGDNLAEVLAQRFNLNKDEVRQVVDEHRLARAVEHQHKMQEHLRQAVKDGKLTQAQADAMIARHQEMVEFKKSLAGKTPEERQAAIEARHQKMKHWAAENNLPAPPAMMEDGAIGPHPILMPIE